MTEGPRPAAARRGAGAGVAVLAVGVLVGGGCAVAAGSPGDASLADAVDPLLREAVAWYTGVAGRVDDQRARALLLRAAADGDALSVMWVARCHSRGRMGFSRDTARARAVAAPVLDDVRTLAAAGVPEAVFLMGTAYDEALGVAEDAAAAAGWYRRAAELGHVLGAHNLGNAYRAGRGVPPDPAAAVRWWRRAADAGDAVTQLRLGEAYEAGAGVAQDLDAARRWYRAAAERGNTPAARALERLGGMRGTLPRR